MQTAAQNVTHIHPVKGPDPAPAPEAEAKAPAAPVDAAKPVRGRRRAKPEAAEAAPEAKAKAKPGRKPKAKAEPAQKAGKAKEDAGPAGLKLPTPASEAEKKVQTELVRLDGRMVTLQSDMGKVRGDMSNEFAIATDRIAVNKKAYRLVAQLKRQAESDDLPKAAEFVRCFDEYRRLLGLDAAIKGLFDDLEKETKRSKKAADGAIA